MEGVSGIELKADRYSNIGDELTLSGEVLSHPCRSRHLELFQHQFRIRCLRDRLCPGHRNCCQARCRCPHSVLSRRQVPVEVPMPLFGGVPGVVPTPGEVPTPLFGVTPMPVFGVVPMPLFGGVPMPVFGDVPIPLLFGNVPMPVLVGAVPMPLLGPPVLVPGAVPIPAPGPPDATPMPTAPPAPPAGVVAIALPVSDPPLPPLPPAGTVLGLLPFPFEPPLL